MAKAGLVTGLLLDQSPSKYYEIRRGTSSWAFGTVANPR